jgi:hypothetical protein
MEGIDGKEQEFALTAPHAESVAKRSKPTLMQFGNRLVPSDGRFHPDLCAEYIRDHGGRDRWIPTGELARVFFGGNTPSNKKQIRRRLFRVWHALLNLDYLLVVDLQPRAGAQACKIYNPKSVEERQWLQARLERMEQQRFLKTEQHRKAIALAACLDAAIAE